MKIIGFGHRKGVGKDTAANFLLTELRVTMPKSRIVKAGFADKVKDVAYQVYAWAGLQQASHYDIPENYNLKDTILPAIGLTPRKLWIGVGNGIRAATSYDGTWLDYLFKGTKADVLIISDVRFPAEADGILSEGGKVYRIDCPWIKKVSDGADEPLENYTNWSGIINNDVQCNFTSFYGQVIDTIKEIKKCPNSEKT